MTDQPHPYEPIIEALTARRKSMGISQLECDRRVGCALGYTAKYEARMRRPTLNSLAMWAEALNCYLTIDSGVAPTRANNWSSDIPIMEAINARGCALNVRESPVRRSTAQEAIDMLEKARKTLELSAPPEPITARKTIQKAT